MNVHLAFAVFFSHLGGGGGGPLGVWGVGGGAGMGMAA